MNTRFPVPLPGTANTLMWADPADIEYKAQEQLRGIAALPWVHGVRVMPDVHLGKGATVGSVIAMPSAVCPAAVGVDIGCGMSAVRTDLRAGDLPDDLGALRSRLEARIPVGFASHAKPVAPASLGLDARPHKRLWERAERIAQPLLDELRRARLQLGTLGGGNHFVEVCLDEEDRVWLMLHSGSRGIGNLAARHHMSIAQDLPHNRGLPNRDTAVFLAGTPEMDAYRHDLEWAQEYALRNREVMLALAMHAVREEFADRGVTFDEPISCHHNYVASEMIDGQPMLVTRKGAIRAGEGELGLIPGSMGTGSYVVRGLGNPESFWSASHGAGRRMSRSKAKQLFTAQDLAEQTAGIECRKDTGVVDEIPAAYKDIDAVIAAQGDLVEVVAKLRQIVCVKG